MKSDMRGFAMNEPQNKQNLKWITLSVIIAFALVAEFTNLPNIAEQTPSRPAPRAIAATPRLLADSFYCTTFTRGTTARLGRFAGSLGNFFAAIVPERLGRLIAPAETAQQSRWQCKNSQSSGGRKVRR